jgi:hypothetical protein
MRYEGGKKKMKKDFANKPKGATLISLDQQGQVL